jgi:hypothetical protein
MSGRGLIISLVVCLLIFLVFQPDQMFCARQPGCQAAMESGGPRDTSSAVGLAPWPAGVPGWGGVSGITYDTIDSEEPSSR